MAVNLPWDLTLAEAAGLIARRECSSAELLEIVLERLHATEPRVRAWALVDEDGARAAAAEADRLLAAGDHRGPLHGIPVGLKDNIETRGLATEAGSRAMAGNVPVADAAVVARLRDAGATILGKTVTHEFAFGQNRPATINPWDPGRYAGGSSVGSGVAVAVGSALAALGTDTGGSVRNPAAVNGLVGLKPTFDLISRCGVVASTLSLDHVGPITRTVTDCALILSELVDPGSAAEGPAAPRQGYAAGLHAPIAGCRVGVDRSSWIGAGISREAGSAVDRSLLALEEQGAVILEVTGPRLEEALTVGLTLGLSEAGALFRKLLGSRALDLAPGTRVMFALGLLLRASDYVWAQQMREVVRADVRSLYEEHRLDVFASPTLPGPAVPLEALETDFTREGEEGDLSGALRLLNWANVTGQPAISVPCGRSSDGMPLGMQLVGRPFAEAALLRIAHAHEQATSWHAHRPPDPIAA